MERASFLKWLVLGGVASLTPTASAQITIASSATSFFDISGTGTSPGTAADDSESNVSAAQLTGAGFGGNELLAATNIRIGNNGAVLWNATTGEVGYINSNTLPSMAASNTTVNGNGGTQVGVQFVCPLWDDHFPSSGQTANALDWQVIAGDLYIQWSFEDHFNAQGTGTIQFQMIVYGGVTIGSAQPLVEFVYNDTLYQALQYQNDGGSSSIGYKNWGVVAAANDVEYGMGGGNNTITDPAYGDPTMKPKVAGWVASENSTLPHSIVIQGSVCTGTPTIYCTGKVNSLGCTPTIGWSGTPTYGATNDFVIHCTNVIENRFGLLFYGFGQAAVPFQGGFMCITQPVSRTAVQTSSGTPTCNGSYSYNFDGRIQSGVDPMLSVGATVYAEYWMRDPPSPSTTGLSDALCFTICPGEGVLVVTNVFPLSGVKGDLITISGTGFDPNPANTCVFVGGRGARATVLNASPTQLICQIEDVAAVQSGDVEIVSGVGSLMGPQSYNSGSYTASSAQPMALATGNLVAANVNFGLLAAAANSDAFAFAAGTLTGTITIGHPVGARINVDLHLKLAGGWKEMIFFMDNTGAVAGAAADVAAAIRAVINAVYGGMGITAGGVGAMVTVTAAGATDGFGSVANR